MVELNPSISNININRETPESIFSGYSRSVSYADSETDLSRFEWIQSIKKFIGKFYKISGNEGHTMNIELKNQGASRNIFLKLSNEDQGHFAHIDDKNISKIHIHHSFGFATLTIDHSKNYIMEENHTDGENWMWEREGPSLSHANPSGIQSITLNYFLQQNIIDLQLPVI